MPPIAGIRVLSTLRGSSALRANSVVGVFGISRGRGSDPPFALSQPPPNRHEQHEEERVEVRVAMRR
jgi:hypothetical protein